MNNIKRLVTEINLAEAESAALNRRDLKDAINANEIHYGLLYQEYLKTNDEKRKAQLTERMEFLLYNSLSYHWKLIKSRENKK